MKHLILGFALFGLLVAAPASAAIIISTAVLSGASEVPPSGSGGTGSATIALDTTAETLFVDVSFSGLTGTTSAAHLHCCTPAPFAGTAGVATQAPYFAGFRLGVTLGPYSSMCDLTLPSSWNPAFATSHGGTLARSADSWLRSRERRGWPALRWRR